MHASFVISLFSGRRTKCKIKLVRPAMQCSMFFGQLTKPFTSLLLMLAERFGLAESSTRNMVSEGRFPIPTTKIGVKRVVSIFVLADFVIRQSPLSLPPKPPKRGPRFKKDRLADQGTA